MEDVNQEEAVQSQLSSVPPAGGSPKIVLAVLAVVAILIIAQLIATALLYSAISELETGDGNGNGDGVGDGDEDVPAVTFCGVEVDGETTAVATFCQMDGSTDPFDLMIILEDPTEWGAYIFPASSDDTGLTRDLGSDIATLVYSDLMDDDRISTGDSIRITGLAEDTEYTIRILANVTGGELDHRTFSTPTPEVTVPVGGFSQIIATSSTSATAVFSGFTDNPPQPIDLKVFIWKDSLSGTYIFPSNANGTTLTLESGNLLVIMQYNDYLNNLRVNAGDELLLSGLDEGEDYVLVLIWALLEYYLDIEVFSTIDQVVPTGVWGQKIVLSSTEVHVEFGKVSSDPRPTQLKIILIRNMTVEGTYVFTSDFDGPLALSSGTNVGTLTYADLADNERINTGDKLMITNLWPGSDYIIRMIWAPTGDQITSTTFSTP